MENTIVEPLLWDSHFLGFRVARIVLSASESNALGSNRLASFIIQAQASEIKLLYLVVNPDDVAGNAAAQQIGADLVDRKLTFSMTVNATESEQIVNGHIQSTQTTTRPLEALALQSGEYSRFQLDSKFETGTYEKLYRQWLHNSLAGTLAREVLVYYPTVETTTTNEEIGLLTLGLRQGYVDIGLLAVAHTSRGQGVGQALVQAARQRTATWGLNRLQVVTQRDNLKACKFYRRCGFHEARLEHIYHLWLST